VRCVSYPPVRAATIRGTPPGCLMEELQSCGSASLPSSPDPAAAAKAAMAEEAATPDRPPATTVRGTPRGAQSRPAYSKNERAGIFDF
jgi:hypothetical protein